MIAECRLRIETYTPFAPQRMDAEQVKAVLTEVLAELGIDAPTPKDKGRIMKTLMPRLKGQADGAVVNAVVSAAMQA